MSNKNKNIKRVIIGLSIFVPVLVAILYYFMPDRKALDIDLRFIPKMNAFINFTVSVLLVFGLYFIKQKEIKKHQFVMGTAFALSVLFLIFYVVYHFAYPPTKYGGEGVLKMIYLFVLLTHIVLAAVVVPFVLFSFYFALTEQIEKHRKLSKITWPIWFYVSVTGVIVYMLISPYY